MGVGDFNVVAKDSVEAHFQVANLRAFSLASLIVGNPFLTARCQLV